MSIYWFYQAKNMNVIQQIEFNTYNSIDNTYNWNVYTKNGRVYDLYDKRIKDSSGWTKQDDRILYIAKENNEKLQSKNCIIEF
jgi:hypothetical protein